MKTENLKLVVMLFIAIFYFGACADESTDRDDEADNQEVPAEVVPESIDIQTMNGIPHGINADCGCFYARTAEEFEKEEYVYVSNLTDEAYLKINGKVQMIDLHNPNEGKFSVLVTIEKDEEIGNGRRSKEGTLAISTYGGASESINFVGECGCDETLND